MPSVVKAVVLRKKLVFSSVAVVVIVAFGLVWSFSNLSVAPKHAKASSYAPLTYSAVAKGPYSVQGNKILGNDGQPYIFHGVGRDGMEYNCSGEGPLDTQHLSYMGTGTNGNGATYWGGNTVRLPLSEGFWLNGAPGYPCSAAQYHSVVKQTVDNLTSLKLNVILDLQWTDAGGQSKQGGGPWAMPDADSVTFWQQVAPIFSSYSNVLFQLYNEPHPSSWACWASSCTISADSGYSDDCKCSKTLTYTSVGLQALVNTVRSAGANNLVLVGGIAWGYDLSQIGTYQITGSNVVYDTHPYPYGDKLPSTWDAAFGNASLTYPVFSAESGEYDCGSSYMSQLLPYFDAHGISWMAWAWAVPKTPDVCGYPQLVTDYNGTPSTSTGLYIYQHLRGYAPPSGVVNKTWYFAEGRVGANFKEYLTISNPDPINDCSINIQYLLDNGPPKTVTATVPHATRMTEPVNADLNVPYYQAAATAVSSIITVNTGTTPACLGVVAERPMYFTWHGINSGSDVMGATHLGQTFFLGDVPTGNGYTSFITVLNPPSNGPANVTATYYLGGKAVGAAQSVTVQPGQRGTIFPTNTGLPGHVAAVVTSNVPVMVERPDYFAGISSGSVQNVSGATSVVGVQTLGNDWLFAEGYTAPGFQENLVISNLDTTANGAPANVTIMLEFSDGTTKAYNVTVNALDQLIWNVNQNAPNANVSAEVTSTGAKIVVEREMYFNYSHAINLSNGFRVTSTGGTDVIGQPGPANITAYTFAEGYSNNGYNEWITLQNPTANDENVYISLVNGYGRSYMTGSLTVHAHSRFTLDISALVLQNLVQPGDDHRGYEVSMSVQTTTPGAYFVAERPMYWNTGGGGTQGGSDVIGYTGQ